MALVHDNLSLANWSDCRILSDPINVMLSVVAFVMILAAVVITCIVTRECTTCQHQGALLLTPYIEEGRIAAGRKAARVPQLLGSIDSYAGFFTVNEEHHSNLFFWYFPAEEPPSENAPVILWLNGGPGASSMYGLLFENGPLCLNANNTLSKRSIYWSKLYHMIYIDNPVGAGFSFTQENNPVSNESQRAKEMHSALIQFFQLFPHLSKNEFFIAGESYAGRYVPSIAEQIHKNNQISKVKINLKGIMIGNGIVDMEFFHIRGVYLTKLGLLDKRTLPYRLEMENRFAVAVKSEDFDRAWKFHFRLLSFEQKYVSMYNYLQETFSSNILERIETFFNSNYIRNYIHVGDVKFHIMNKKVVIGIWESDGFMNVSPYVEELLENYRVLYYNGQLDTTLIYSNCEDFTEKLIWSEAYEYHRAPRMEWKVGDKLAGFSRSGGNLTLVLVRNAGHMVPQDQPEWALDMITKFVNGQEIT